MLELPVVFDLSGVESSQQSAGIEKLWVIKNSPPAFEEWPSLIKISSFYKLSTKISAYQLLLGNELAKEGWNLKHKYGGGKNVGRN
jgi:hypothetical protein